jgi:L-alanine-DL-glutamate epimerase-like enolase superfamily enzyme
MKITKIECTPITFGYKKLHVYSGVSRSVSEIVIVKVHTDEGITGIAETGSTVLVYQGETPESIMGVINGLFGPKILIGEDPFNIEKIVAKMDVAAKYNNQAKEVIDFALHDIIGKALGVPLYKYLGGLSVEKMRLGWVVGGSSPEDTAATAVQAKEAGYGYSIKLKVAYGTVEEDLASLEAIREAVGDDVRLSIDVNGGWNYYEALENLKKMEKFNLVWAEQPVPWWDVNGLARLRRKVGTPIFADESAAELKHVLELIEKDAVDGLFLKVAKAGGIVKSRKWVDIAKAAGLPVICGCMTGSQIEAAAQAHFLFANEWMSHIEQENIGSLYRHQVFDTITTPLEDDLAMPGGGPKYKDGYMYPPEGIGLGVELNEELVEKLRTPGKSPTVIEG